MESVQPNMKLGNVTTFDRIILTYLAIAGHEHYDACIKPAITGRTQLRNSPSKTVEETATLSRKTHGTFEGTDKRGKHTPDNKTSDETGFYSPAYQVLSYNG